MNCFNCNSEDISEVSKSWEIDYKGSPLVIEGLTFVQCGDCGKSYEGPEQGKQNERIIADSKRERDGLLSSYEIEALLDQFDISKSEASRYFGGSPNSFSKYIRGESLQSVAVDKMLRLARDVPAVFIYLSELDGRPTSRVQTVQTAYTLSLHHSLSEVSVISGAAESLVKQNFWFRDPNSIESNEDCNGLIGV